MLQAIRIATRSCVRSFGNFGEIHRRIGISIQKCYSYGRYNTNNASTNSKIAVIVDQISQLTLLETADLVKSLKSRLNIPDMPTGGFAVAGSSNVATPVAPVEEEETAPVQQEKTMFNLKLQSFDTAAKPKIIKEIKSLLGLSLVDSKKFVESAPKLMKEGVAKEEAEKIVSTLKALGGVVIME